jgi:acetyl esterase
MPGPDVTLASVEDRRIPGPAGELPVRIYTPEGDGPFPVIVYFHGGGWVVGDLDTQDMIARGLAAGAGSVLISVEYRLAPEHPFPAAPDDAFAATRWAAEHAVEIGGDADRLAVAGDSAGAVLACAVALQARDCGGPKLRAQVNFYGSCNYPSESTGSAREFENGPILTKDDVDHFWSLYLADPAQPSSWVLPNAIPRGTMPRPMPTSCGRPAWRSTSGATPEWFMASSRGLASCPAPVRRWTTPAPF